MAGNDEKHLALIRQIYEKSNEARDKALLTLCSAALGVSLSFYEKIYSGHCVWFLMLTWALFAIAMLATLYSFIAAASAADRLHTYTEGKEKHKDNERLIGSIHRWNGYTKGLNTISVSCFTFGVIVFIVFAMVNIQGAPMSNPRELQNGCAPLSTMLPENIQRGIPLPSSTLPAKPAQQAAPAAPIAPAKPAVSPAAAPAAPATNEG